MRTASVCRSVRRRSFERLTSEGSARSSNEADCIHSVIRLDGELRGLVLGKREAGHRAKARRTIRGGINYDSSGASSGEHRRYIRLDLVGYGNPLFCRASLLYSPGRLVLWPSGRLFIGLHDRHPRRHAAAGGLRRSILDPPFPSRCRTKCSGGPATSRRHCHRARCVLFPA